MPDKYHMYSVEWTNQFEIKGTCIEFVWLIWMSHCNVIMWSDNTPKFCLVLSEAYS